MSESFAKKERNKHKAKKKQDKEQKMLDRKQSGAKATSFEDMIAYVDENGNLTDKPVTAIRSEIKLEDIQLGAAPIIPEPKEFTAKVATYDSAKGYGFILDDRTGVKIFVHNSGLTQPVKDNDKVSYEREKGERGYVAVNVKIKN